MTATDAIVIGASIGVLVGLPIGAYIGTCDIWMDKLVRIFWGRESRL